MATATIPSAALSRARPRGRGNRQIFQLQEQVTIIAQAGTELDFALESTLPKIEVSPVSLTSIQPVGSVKTQTLTITNAGSAPLTFDLGDSELTGNIMLDFDGVDDPLTMGDVLMLTNSDFTVEFWLSTSQTTPGFVVGKHDSGWWNGYDFWINGDYGGDYSNKVWFYTADNFGEVAVSSTDINDGQWHLLQGSIMFPVTKNSSSMGIWRLLFRMATLHRESGKQTTAPQY